MPSLGIEFEKFIEAYKSELKYKISNQPEWHGKMLRLAKPAFKINLFSQPNRPVLHPFETINSDYLDQILEKNIDEYISNTVQKFRQMLVPTPSTSSALVHRKEPMTLSEQIKSHLLQQSVKEDIRDICLHEQEKLFSSYERSLAY